MVMRTGLGLWVPAPARGRHLRRSAALLGQYEGAIAGARTVIAGMPDQFFAYRKRGMAYHEFGRANETIGG